MVWFWECKRMRIEGEVIPWCWRKEGRERRRKRKNWMNRWVRHLAWCTLNYKFNFAIYKPLLWEVTLQNTLHSLFCNGYRCSVSFTLQNEHSPKITPSHLKTDQHSAARQEEVQRKCEGKEADLIRKTHCQLAICATSNIIQFLLWKQIPLLIKLVLIFFEGAIGDRPQL